MNELEYTYAVARVRALEASLLTDAVIEQLVSSQSYEQCIQLLTEKGWGDASSTITMEEMLNLEEKKTWQVIQEIAPDISVFDVFSYSKLYHNLKAAIKEVCTEENFENIFYDDCAIPGNEMLSIIQQKEFSRLPGNMPQAAQDAYETLLQTRDGQLCDVIVDKAALEAIRDAGERSDEEVIQVYAQSTVALADIQIAVRCAKTGKSADFMRRAMATCDEINVEQLIRAALGGVEAIQDYLSQTTYAKGAEALSKSPSAFECWCDNRMTENMKPQKYNAFSAGPLAAYYLARENEIKTVRIILTGKQNAIPDEVIRERIREMYV